MQRARFLLGMYGLVIWLLTAVHALEGSDSMEQYDREGRADDPGLTSYFLGRR